MPKFTVLIIEDEKNIQTFVGKILKKQDYRVLYADCGKEGLNLIHSQCPDVIILDLGLPDMNGNDIIQEVRPEPVPRSLSSPHEVPKRKRFSHWIRERMITLPSHSEPQNCLPASVPP